MRISYIVTWCILRTVHIFKRCIPPHALKRIQHLDKRCNCTTTIEENLQQECSNTTGIVVKAQKSKQLCFSCSLYYKLCGRYPSFAKTEDILLGSVKHILQSWLWYLNCSLISHHCIRRTISKDNTQMRASVSNGVVFLQGGGGGENSAQKGVSVS